MFKQGRNAWNKGLKDSWLNDRSLNCLEYQVKNRLSHEPLQKKISTEQNVIFLDYSVQISLVHHFCDHKIVMSWDINYGTEKWDFKHACPFLRVSVVAPDCSASRSHVLPFNSCFLEIHTCLLVSKVTCSLIYLIQSCSSLICITAPLFQRGFYVWEAACKESSVR